MPLTSSLENVLKAVFSLRQARERVRWKGIYKRRRFLGAASSFAFSQ